MHEYFRLLGLDCPPDLRRRLDTALHIADEPRPDRYAVFSLRYDGGCPLHGEDGLCSLQKAMGEGAIPSICRLYPRRHSNLYADECCCSDGCEETLELLFSTPEKLHFLTVEQAERFDSGMTPEPLIASWYRAVRQRCLSVVSNRSLPFPDRLIGLGRLTEALESAMKAGDEAAIRAALCADCDPADAPCGDAGEALATAFALMRAFVSKSPSLMEYESAVTSAFGPENGDGTGGRYRAAAQRFEARYPDHALYFEKLFSNHIFYTSFPFSGGLNLRAAFSSLAAAYALLRFMLLGVLRETDGMAELVDVCAAVFRMIESSSFHARAAVLLFRSQRDSRDKLNALIKYS